MRQSVVRPCTALTRRVVQTVAVVFVAVFVAALSGCPEPRPLVDQTQANAILKSQFDDEWYFQRTVVDTPYETAFTMIGDQGELERIRWRIEENLLIAVRSYERYEGSDPDVNEDGDYEGNPVAAWPITAHFDIRRDYNSTTGEEYNVLVENTSDRQWWEREWIRVDWTTNVITNWNFYAPNAVTLEPAAIAITDPTSPDAPVIEEDYLEINSAFLAAPGSEIDPYWGEFPLCWYFFVFDDCTASEVKVRNSFMKVTDRGYEAQEWSGTDMELFGYFDTSRFDYDEQYGPTNEGRTRWQMRWNIWDRSHDDRSCETVDDCNDVVGSTCDDDYNGGLCTLPYRDRPVRKIVYHASPNLDPGFAMINDEVVDQWNVGFADTVNALRYHECLDDGGSESDCESEIDPDIEVVAFCPNNPVQADDPAYCGRAGLAPRLGDLRYNFLYNVVHPGLGNPFGFGPAGVDPLSGEVINAAAIVYEAEVRSYAAWARDVVQLLNGEISEQDFIDGENVASWINSREALIENPVTYSEADVERLTSKVQLHHRAALPSLGTPDRSSGGKVEALQHARDILRHHPAVSADHGFASARLDALIDSPIEEALMNDEHALMNATVPGSVDGEALRQRASPLRRVRDHRIQVANAARKRRNAQRCAYWKEFVDPSVEGHAASFAGMDPEDIRWELMLGLHRGTMAHEVGHTLGLRHNLEGSADPLNYGEEYWNLRDDGTMQPRYLDPETDAEIDGRIREHQYSSVMDYLSRFNSDSLGAKSYDMAAIKFGYGRVLEVMTDENTVGWFANDLLLSNTFGYPGAYEYDNDDSLMMPHYTDYWDWLGDLYARRDVPQHKLMDWYEMVDFWDSPHTAYLSSDIGEPVVPYRFCSDEFAGSGITCIYFDEGADLYEIPLDLAQRYERYYIFNNFGRNRLWFSPDGYMYRIWDSYFDPMVSLNQWWVLFSQDLYATEVQGDDIDGFLQRTDGFGPFTMGVRETFNVFARTLARPEPGGFIESQDVDGNPSWEPLWYSEDLVVGLDDGRYLSTNWDYDEGYFWDEIVHTVGYFTDKSLAMEALFDPTTYFLGQDTSADLRGFRVNYGLNFFEPLMELVADLMVGDKAGFAPWVIDGDIVFPDYADFPVTIPGNAVPLNPNADFTIQFHTMVMGLALLPDTFDSEIIDSTRLWYEGGFDEITSDRPTVSHTDPDSGITWVAATYDDSGTEEGVAARMLDRANLLALQAGFAEAGGNPEEAERLGALLSLHRENLNLLRAIHVELGSLDFNP